MSIETFSFIAVITLCAVSAWYKREKKEQRFLQRSIGALAAIIQSMTVIDMKPLYMLQDKFKDCKSHKLDINDPFMTAYSDKDYLAFAYLSIKESLATEYYDEYAREELESFLPKIISQSFFARNYGSPFRD